MVGLLAELAGRRCLGSVGRVEVALLGEVVGLLAELAGSELCIRRSQDRGLGGLSTLAEEALLADVVGLLAVDTRGTLLGGDLFLESVDLDRLVGDHLAKRGLLSLAILVLESVDLVDLGGKQHANNVLLSNIDVSHLVFLER